MARRRLFGRTVVPSLYIHICVIVVNILGTNMTRFGKSLNLITVIVENTLPTDQINIIITVVVVYIHTTKLLDKFILSLFKQNGAQGFQSHTV